MADIPYNDQNPRPGFPATSGGQGSFSYADTKVFGPRQAASIPQFMRYQGNNNDGTYLWLPPYTQSTEILLPGSGGGAKAPGKRYYGSRAVGFKPEGLVLIRLMKLD